MGIEEKLKGFEEWNKDVFFLLNGDNETIFFWYRNKVLYKNNKKGKLNKTYIINDDYSFQNEINERTVVVYYNKRVYFKKERLNEETKGINGMG